MPQLSKAQILRLSEAQKLLILRAAIRELRNAGSLIKQDEALGSWKESLPEELYLRLLNMLRARTRP